MTKKKPTVISLDEDQLKWIENKVEEEGYSRSGIIRVAIKRLMEEPKKETKEIAVKQEQAANTNDREKEEPLKKVDIGKLLDVLIEWGEAGKLDDSGMNIPEIMETAKMMKYRLANVDRLSPQMAFMIGEFKGEMELKVGQWIQTHSTSKAKQ